MKENPNNVIVESGNISNLADRLDLVASVLNGLHYDAVGVGETDLRVVGDPFFEAMAKNKLTVLDASAKARKTTIPYMVKNVDGVKVGVISFGAEPAGANQNQYTRRKALYTAYKAVRSACDVLVVLDQAELVTKEWVERNAERLGAPDVVVGGVKRSSLQQEQVVGRTHFMPTSTQGKTVGVLDVDVASGQEPKIKARTIMLEANVVEEEAISARVKDFMARLQQVGKYTPVPNPGPQYAGNTGKKPYYASALCKACHVKEYDDWKSTKHALALSTLVDQNRSIPECLKCHSEQYRRLQPVTLTPRGEGGVECASCHLDSLPHGMDRKNATVKAKVNPQTCIECHDKQQSPNYEEKSYMSRVSHTAGAATRPAAKPAPARPPTTK